MRAIDVANYFIEKKRIIKPLTMNELSLINNLVLLVQAAGYTLLDKSVIEDEIKISEDGIYFDMIEEVFGELNAELLPDELVKKYDLSKITDNELIGVLEKVYSIFSDEKDEHIIALVNQLPSIRKYMKENDKLFLDIAMEERILPQSEIRDNAYILKRLFGMVDTARKKDQMRPIRVSGKTFYYDANQVTPDEKMIVDLRMFAKMAQGDNYTIYLEGDHLIIF